MNSAFPCLDQRPQIPPWQVLMYVNKLDFFFLILHLRRRCFVFCHNSGQQCRLRAESPRLANTTSLRHCKLEQIKRKIIKHRIHNQKILGSSCCAASQQLGMWATLGMSLQFPELHCLHLESRYSLITLLLTGMLGDSTRCHMSSVWLLLSV